MHSTYLLYPGAREKIAAAGIASRVEKLKKSEEGLPYIGGFVSTNDVKNTIKGLQQQGYYARLPKDVASRYKATLDAVWNDGKSRVWQVCRPEGVVQEPCELEDVLLFAGEYAALVLKPDEFWEHERFGFEDPIAFIGVVSAYVREQSHLGSFRKGYAWSRRCGNGAEIVTEITGDMHCDLRVVQTDVAPYATLSPFGDGIEMRPELNNDRSGLYPGHSTESTLFVALMRYAEQVGIDADYRKDKGRALLNYARSLGQGGGLCAEHYGGFDMDPRMFFTLFDHAIPSLDDTGKGRGHSVYHLGGAGRGCYTAYVAPKGDLVWCFEGEDKEDGKGICARFVPQDVDEALKGLLFQSAKGLGRTSARQLMSLLSYRYSSEFEQFMQWTRGGCDGPMPR